MPRCRQRRSRAVRVGESGIMVFGHRRPPSGIPVSSANGKRFPHPVRSPRRTEFARQPITHAAPHRFGHRHPLPASPPLELPMLLLCELYLGSDHDVILIPL